MYKININNNFILINNLFLFYFFQFFYFLFFIFVFGIINESKLIIYIHRKD